MHGVTLFSLADRAPDAALVAGLTVQDEWAAVAFVRRFEGPVFGLALSITRDRGLAEDVSQEAFLRAWRAAATYDQRRGSVMTWLLPIDPARLAAVGRLGGIAYTRTTDRVSLPRPEPPETPGTP